MKINVIFKCDMKDINMYIEVIKLNMIDYFINICDFDYYKHL